MRVVDMNQCKVSVVDSVTHKVNSSLLKTIGISTCIAIIFQGVYQDFHYVGLYHWPGFASKEQSTDDMLSDIFEVITNEIRSEIPIENDELPSINGLYIIGGEKLQKDEHGIIVSGTEEEVQLLHEHALRLCENYFEIDEKFDLLFCNYLTQNLESIDIKVFSNRLSYSYPKGSFPDYEGRMQSNTVKFGEYSIARPSCFRC